MATKLNVKIPAPSNKTWAVKGADLEEVFKALQAHGWWGRYRGNVTWSWKAKDKKVTEIGIAAKPVITMPKWGGYGAATADEKKSWDSMFAALLKHEQNHHKKTNEAVAEFKKKVAKIGDVPEADAKKVLDQFGKDLQKKQDDYDKSSKHGQNEGVILNIP